MKQNKTIDIKSAEIKETELEEVSGGIDDISENEFYQDGNKNDLFNPDFLSELLKQ